MTRSSFTCLLVAIALAIIVMPVARAFADDVFVDLDGDGIDDNLVDFKDGFFLSGDQTATGMPGGSQVIDFFSDLDDNAPTDLPMTAKESFTSRRFNARVICNCRLDLDADFNSGSGSGSSSSGSHCVGGVCY